MAIMFYAMLVSIFHPSMDVKMPETIQNKKKKTKIVIFMLHKPEYWLIIYMSVVILDIRIILVIIMIY